MKEWIQTAKKSFQKEVTSPISGRTFTIRKLLATDLLQAGLTPVIDMSKEKPPQVDSDNKTLAEAQAIQWLASMHDKFSITQTRYVIENGVVDPKVVYTGEPADDNAVKAAWISEDESWLYLEIVCFSGINEPEQRAKLDLILKNASGSEQSTH